MTASKIDPRKVPATMHHLIPHIEERFLDGTEQEFYPIGKTGDYAHIKPEQLAQHSYGIIDVRARLPLRGPVVTYGAGLTLKNKENGSERFVRGDFEETWLLALSKKRLDIDVVSEIRRVGKDRSRYGELNKYLSQMFSGVDVRGVAIDFSRDQWEEHSKLVKVERFIPSSERERYREWVCQNFQDDKKLDFLVGILV